MRKLLLFCLTLLLIQSCGVNQQARQLQALKDCVYKIASADSLYLAGTDITKMVQNRNIEINRIPAVALAFLRKDIPFEARLNLNIENPGSEMAAINQFEYLVFIKDQEIANGFMNQKTSIAPGQSTTVPVKLKSNIYRFLSNGKTMEQIIEFIRGGADGTTEKKGTITLKIKPTIQIGNRLVKYPDYITIDKEVSSKILF